MKLYAYSRTMAGAQRLARALVVALVVAPVPSKVLRFPKRAKAYEPMRIPSTGEVSRARHLAFLAGLNIATETPVKLLIERIAAWHRLTYVDIIRDCRRRRFVVARDDAICAVFLTYPDATLPWLGQRFLRDHTTILHALRKRGLR